MPKKPNSPTIPRYTDGVPVTIPPREAECFRYCGDGLTTWEMARIMNVKEKTIASFKARLKDRLDLESTAKMIHYATLYFHLECDNAQRSLRKIIETASPNTSVPRSEQST